MNLVKAFLLKALSALLFALLSACVRYLGEQSVPLGQVVFFRAAFAIVPVLLIDAWRRELADVVRTERPLGHLLARHHQHGRHVPQLRGAGAAAAGRRHGDLVCGAADHRGVRRVVSRRARPHLSLVRGRRRLRRHHRHAVALSQPRAIRSRRLGDGRRHRRRGLRAARRLHQRRLGDPDPAAHRHRDHVVDRVLLLAVSARSQASPPCRSAGSGRARCSLPC